MRSAVDEYLQQVYAKAWPYKGGQIDEHDLSAAFAYSLFGLPDGSLAPSGMTLAPGPDTLRRSLLKVIFAMLKQEEQYLLKTPIEFARVPFIDAAHVFDDTTGEHWIVLNHSLFGALYSANDRLIEIFEVEKGITKVEDPIALACRFPDLICRFMLGEQIGDDAWTVRMETHVNAELCYLIGTYTSVQQVFFILHELGHVFLSHGRTEANAFGTHMSVWRSGSSAASWEDDADSFAAAHMRDGPWPDRVTNNPKARVIGLFMVFECLELLSKLGKYLPDSHTAPRERFRRICTVIDPNSLNTMSRIFASHQSLLDDIFTVWHMHKTGKIAI